MKIRLVLRRSAGASQGAPPASLAGPLGALRPYRAHYFFARARWQPGDLGLDLGAGLPTAQNTHQIAQAVNPAAAVAYGDRGIRAADGAGKLPDHLGGLL